MRWKSLLLVGLAAIGCSGGRPNALDGDTDDAVAARGADADVVDDDAADAAPKAPPVAAAGSRLVIPGAATLVGHGQDSCTNAPGASGDRWCAFGRPDDAGAGFYELWVLDVTKAAAGAAIRCDGTDASCVRVSPHLFWSRQGGFGDSGFNGDTLIYAETPYPGKGDEPFVGVLAAWRPGWTTARALTSAEGRYCVGHDRSDAVYCFETLEGDGTIMNVTIELHAGRLSSATGGVLPKVDALLLTATTDAPGAPPRYQYDLSPSGDYLLWSTRAASDGAEALHAQKIGGTDAPLVVANNVSRWAASPDGLAWYWLATYNYDVMGAPSGTLQAAAFPDGSTPQTLATAVADFGAVGDKGLWLRSEVGAQVGTLRWMADRGAPAATSIVDAKVLTVLSATPTRLLYAKTFAPVRPGPVTTTSVAQQLVDLYVGATAGGAPCVISETPAALHAALSPAGDLVVWDLFDMATTDEQGLATTVATCVSTPFATRLGGLLPAGAAGYVYQDDADRTSDEATLRYAHAVNGALVAGTPIQTRAAPVFAPLAPALPAVAYTVATGTAADGLYVYVDVYVDAAGASP